LSHQLVACLCILWNRETSLLHTVREAEVWQRGCDDVKRWCTITPFTEQW